MKFNIMYNRPSDTAPFDSGWTEAVQGYDTVILDAYKRRGFRIVTLDKNEWLMYHETLGSRVLSVKG